MTRTLAVGLAVAVAAGGAAWAQTSTAPATPPPPGVGPYVVQMIEKACLPLIHGQSLKTVVQAVGLKHSHDDWVLVLPGVEKITLSPPTQANPSVCTLTLNYEIDQAKAVVDVLSNWAGAQTPPLAPLGSDYHPNPSVTSWTWSVDNDQSHEGLVFNAQKTADGKPLGRNYDVGTVLFSWRGA